MGNVYPHCWSKSWQCFCKSQNVETSYFFRFHFSVSCCDTIVLSLWLGLATKTTCKVRKSHVLVTTNMAGNSAEVYFEIPSGLTLTNVETVSNCGHWLHSPLSHLPTWQSDHKHHLNMIRHILWQCQYALSGCRTRQWFVRNVCCQHFGLSTGL